MQRHVQIVKSRRRACFLLPLLLVIAHSAAADSGDEAARSKRSVTVRDTIEMIRWADRDYFLGADPGDRVGIFSPDGREFIVVVRKGNVRRNSNEFSLLLFHTREALQTPKPRILLTMSSRSNRDAISHLRWLQDGHTITFLGENLHGMPQVYALDIRTRLITALTRHPTPVLAYDVDATGRTLVYEAAPQNQKGIPPSQLGGIVITNQSPTDLVAYGCAPIDALGSEGAELFVQQSGRPVRRVPSAEFLTPTQTLSLATNGRYALLAAYVRYVPDWWREYQDRILQGNISERRRTGVRSSIREYMLLDTRTGELTELVGTPIAGSNDGFRWAKDGNSIILSGAYLPVDVPDPTERDRRKSSQFVIEVRLPQKDIVKITTQDLRIEGWGATGRLLLAPRDPTRGVARETFERNGLAWARVPSSDAVPALSTPLTVTLEEDMNTPPKIFVSDPARQRKRLLIDLNPQFADLSLGRVEAVHWKATDGNEFNGGLYFPPDYQAGARYPLVIQTHGFRQDRFWIDGPWSSAFAAQPLAARGMMVLQVGGSIDPVVEVAHIETPEEGPIEMAAYEGAVDELDRRGIIDRERVGIIGFSRTVYYVEYTLTHSKYRFRAAILADGIDGGYVNYMLWPADDYPLVNGGVAFGSSLSRWLANSPGFNLDRITTPVHLEYYGRSGFLGGWQVFSGLSLLGKPVDFVWMPDGTHILVKPSERMTSQQGTVDWFRFWLVGEEDPDPAKKRRYQDWERLRALGEREPRPAEPSSIR